MSWAADARELSAWCSVVYQVAMRGGPWSVEVRGVGFSGGFGGLRYHFKLFTTVLTSRPAQHSLVSRPCCAGSSQPCKEGDWSERSLGSLLLHRCQETRGRNLFLNCCFGQEKMKQAIETYEDNIPGDFSSKRRVMKAKKGEKVLVLDP